MGTCTEEKRGKRERREGHRGWKQYEWVIMCYGTERERINQDDVVLNTVGYYYTHNVITACEILQLFSVTQQ